MLPTVGCISTSRATASKSSPVRSIGVRTGATRATSRCIFGGLPNSTSIGRSIGGGSLGASSFRTRSAVAWPTTANGQRSRAQIAANASSRSGAIAST